MKNKILLILIPLLLLTMVVSAHGGRTDSSGGHRDNSNVSGLGSYHYHCGGRPPHLHNGGVCPYDKKSNSKDINGLFYNKAEETTSNWKSTAEKYVESQKSTNSGLKKISPSAIDNAYKKSSVQQSTNTEKEDTELSVWWIILLVVAVLIVGSPLFIMIFLSLWESVNSIKSAVCKLSPSYAVSKYEEYITKTEEKKKETDFAYQDCSPALSIDLFLNIAIFDEWFVKAEKYNIKCNSNIFSLLIVFNKDLRQRVCNANLRFEALADGKKTFDNLTNHQDQKNTNTPTNSNDQNDYKGFFIGLLFIVLLWVGTFIWAIAISC